MPLNPRQTRHLRALGHHLEPVVLVGDAGITEGILREVRDALRAHELIKVRLAGDRDARREGSAKLAADTGAEIAQQIGRIVLLYRPAPAPAERRISLPE